LAVDEQIVGRERLPDRADVSVGEIFRRWLPLAISFELMMLEGPAIQGAIGRLPSPSLNLAAWGLTMAIALVIESPVIMLLATAIALVKDAQTYRALRSFVILLCLTCTAITGLVAFTPLFDLVALHVMRQPQEIANAARPALQIMLLWTAAIGWRRFYQGILVGHHRTHLVSMGTAIRLAAAVGTAVILARSGLLGGASVGACAIIVAVVTEAVATTCFALPVINREVVTAPKTPTALSQRTIFEFHTPLAATTLLTLLGQPLCSTALALLADPKRNLAASPVVFMLLLVMRGWGFALQEITVAQAQRPEARASLQKFAWIVGIVTSGATALIVSSPLMSLYLGSVLKAPPEIWQAVRLGVGIGSLLPLVTSLGSWARGVLVAEGRPKAVYHGMAVNIGSLVGLLAVGVLARLPGMTVAAGAFTLAALIELGYLMRRI
jgi:hypothetical protein